MMFVYTVYPCPRQPFRRPPSAALMHLVTKLLPPTVFLYSNIPSLNAFTASSPLSVISPSTSLALNMLTPRTPLQVQLEIKDPVDPTALVQSRAILDELLAADDDNKRSSVNPKALISIARRLSDIPPASSSYTVSSAQCKEAFDSLSDEDRRSLLNIHARVKLFADAQRGSVVDVEVDIPGGKAGHTVSPCRGTSSW